jgi:outer membrane protein assembly factor BamB
MALRNRILILAAASAVAHAQFGRGGADWMAVGNDAQRSSWIRTDGKISAESLRKPGFDFIWKVNMDSATKQPFAAPVLLNSYIGYRGFRSLGFAGTTGDKVVGVDTDLGRVEWRQQLPVTAVSTCAATMTAVTRPTTAAFPSQQMAMGGGGGRRGGPAKSASGEPFEGAVTLKEVAMNFAPPVPPGGRGAAGRGGGRGGFGRLPSLLHVVTRDGMLHSIYVSNGEPSQPPVRFAPVNSNLAGLMVVDNVAYAAAGQGCDGAPDRLLALDLESKQVAEFRAEGGAIAGTTGFAMGPDGAVYVSTTTGDLLALEPKTLKPRAAYKAGQPFSTTPVIFQRGDKAWLSAATKDGRIHVLDTSAMSTALTISSPSNTPVSTLATWQDASGTRWLLGPAAGAVVAWKLADRSGSPSLESGWTSRDLAAPLAPVVVNGVAFTVSAGSSPVLYALDGSTGKDLWNSGRKIASAIRGGGISVGNSQVFLGSNDGTLYVFGFPMEH